MEHAPALNFLVDAQLPPALARFLQSHGYAAVHVADAGLLNSDDNPIWECALDRGAVIVTKDEDFADFATLRANGPPVVWLRVGNCSNRALLTWFAPLLPSIVERLASGDALVEVV